MLQFPRSNCVANYFPCPKRFRNSIAKIQELGLRALSALALDPVVRRNPDWWEATSAENGGATAAIVEAMNLYDGNSEVQSA